MTPTILTRDNLYDTRVRKAEAYEASRRRFRETLMAQQTAELAASSGTGNGYDVSLFTDCSIVRYF